MSGTFHSAATWSAFKLELPELKQKVATRRYPINLLLEWIYVINKQFSSFAQGEEEVVIEEIIKELMPRMSHDSNSLAMFYNILRVTRPNGTNLSEAIVYIPIKYHYLLLNELKNLMTVCDPPHWVFDGDVNSYIETKSFRDSISMLSRCDLYPNGNNIDGFKTMIEGYTIALWIKFDNKMGNMKGFTLLTCRTKDGNISVFVSNQLPDGCWNIIITINTSTNPGVPINCKVLIPVNEWTLLTLRHHKGYHPNTDTLALFINGEETVESNELPFPFINFKQFVEATWLIGEGFHGKIASMAVYNQEIEKHNIKLLYDMTPHNPTFTHANVSVPLSSADTGNSYLGSKLTKNKEVCKILPFFCLCPIHSNDAFGVLKVIPGKLTHDCVEMIPQPYDIDDLSKYMIPETKGSCNGILGSSILHSCKLAGGCAVPLYLIWSYSMLLRNTDNTQQAVYPPHIVQECISASIDVLAKMIRNSSALKEQFLQIHGFHLISNCLFKFFLCKKENLVVLNEECDLQLVDSCIELTSALGIDVLSGDGISAALQGLLFDFRIWSQCSLLCRSHLLDGISKIIDFSGEQIYRSIGAQRLLDMIRVHILSNDGNGDVLDPKARLDSIVGIADTSHLFLNLCVLYALQLYEKQQRVQVNPHLVVPELSAMIKCLEETTDALIAERLLRLLDNYRMNEESRPAVLRVLKELKYVDQTAVSLLSKRKFSLNVRKQAMSLVYWIVCEDLADMSVNLNKLMKQYHANGSISNPFNLIDATNTTGGSNASMSQQRRNEQLKNNFINNIKKPALKAWKDISMLSELIYRQLRDNLWDDVSELEHIFEYFIYDKPTGPLGSKPWLVLPLLPSCFAKICGVDGAACQTVLNSLNIKMKSDDSILELLSSLDDSYWMRPLLYIALNGELIYYNSRLPSSDKGSAYRGAELALNASEMCLMSIVNVLEYKLKSSFSNSSDASKTFEFFDKSLKAQCMATFSSDMALYTQMQAKIMKRVVSFILHRLMSISSSSTSQAIIKLLQTIFKFIHENCLCGGEVLQLRNLAPKGKVTESNEPPGHSKEELQILSFVMDIMVSLHKQATAANWSMKGLEKPIFDTGLAIVMGSMIKADLVCANRIYTVIIDQLKYMSSPIGAASSNQYREFVYGVSSHIYRINTTYKLSNSVMEAYNSTIYSMTHLFIELRHESVPDHVLPTLDNMHGVETLDVLSIHKLIEASLGGSGVSNNYTTTSPSGSSKNTGASLDQLQSDDEFAMFEDRSSNSGTNSPNPAGIIEPDSYFMADDKFYEWLGNRNATLHERIEVERSRLSTSMASAGIIAEATSKYWKRLKRKVENEVFYDAHPCQYKLNVSHEGVYPSRAHLVIRPRFEILEETSHSYNSPVKSEEDSKSVSSPAMSSVEYGDEEARRALAKACVGYIKNVTQIEEEAVVAAAGGSSDASKGVATNDMDELYKYVDKAPGDTWGLVDQDEFEEGGASLVGAVSVPHSTSDAAGTRPPDNGESNMESIRDIRLLEEAIKNRKEVDTAPLHSRSTRRISNAEPSITAKVMMVTASGSFHGQLSFNGKDIYFTSSLQDNDLHDSAVVNAVSLRIRRRRWTISFVHAIYLRRYRLRDSAMEVFFKRGKHRNFFVDFGHTKENRKTRDAFAKKLMDYAPKAAFKQYPMLAKYGTSTLMQEHEVFDNIQERWIHGNVSNFDYLMALNTISGRSFNDLCQYPIMPWVIAQYDQPTIDLSNPATYRDLRKPVGALNEERLRDYLDRYNSFSENVTNDIPPFMYGSHYSTMVGVVLHFLVRLQPYAALHKEMQNGHFDVADRLFSSIPNSFRHNTGQLSEVKELIPEFFTNPNIFRNINNFDFGYTQEGNKLNDVELPPWASTPEEFVRINREALESEYVSKHINEWIDLIWGYKQIGREAVEAHNVFYYLTYIDGVDRDRIEDEELRKALELQSAHFGQIPMQLFTTPHPKRKTHFTSNNKKPYILERPANLVSKWAPINPRPLNKCFQLNITSLKKESSNEVVDPLSAVGTLAQPFYKYLTRSQDIEETMSTKAPCTLIYRTPAISSSANLAPERVAYISILNERFLCVTDNGIVEVYKYSINDGVKHAISQLSARPPSPVNDAMNSRNRVRSEEFVDANSKEQGNIYEHPLVIAEKDTTPYEDLPRVPVMRPISTDTKCVLMCGTNNEVIISGGMLDGSVAVRELDLKTGFIKSGGDFIAHSDQVVCIASDSMRSSFIDVICSCDIGGQVFVWSIEKKYSIPPPGGNSNNSNSNSTITMPRRPIRAFRCHADPAICCDLSWSMGILAVASVGTVSIFSIDRDERLLAFDAVVSDSITSPAPQFMGYSSTYVGTNLRLRLPGEAETPRPAIIIRKLCICDDGYILLHTTANNVVDATEHCVIACTIAGHRVGICYWYQEDAISCFVVPGRGSILVTGHENGVVRFHRCQDLLLLGILIPSMSYVLNTLSTPHNVALGNTTPNNSTKRATKVSEAVDSKASKKGSKSSALPSAIASIRVGPNPQCPAIIVVSCNNGAVYIKSLPDFIRWERNRTHSFLAKMVTAPAQVLNNGIQIAQNAVAWTKSTIDDVAEELKKIKPLKKIWENAFGFFNNEK